MAKTVFTGWRTVTPGNCSICGCDDDWECDGRGTILCNCTRCHECGEHEGHRSTCSEAPEASSRVEPIPPPRYTPDQMWREADDEGPTSQPEDPEPRLDDEGGF